MHPLSQFKYCPKCGTNDFKENDFKSNKCRNCGFTYYFNISSSTIALILNEEKELLVATRAHEPVKGTLDLPGGFVDMDENGEEAVIREVKEETGLEVDSLNYLFSIPNRYMYSDFEIQTLDLVYLCNVKDTSNLRADDDVSDLQFIKIADLQPDLFGLASVKEVVKTIQKMKI